MIKNSKINSKVKFFLGLIILLGFLFRIVGLGWDQGQHLHPDERFLTMVLGDIEIPENLFQYLDPQESPLNPYNQNYSFYVYGSFPLNLVKSLAVLLDLDAYNQIYLLGRVVTILLDTLIILLIFLVCQKIFTPKIGLMSSFLYSVCVLPVQLSHFFTVDPFLNFFILLSFYLLLHLPHPRYRFLFTLFLSLSFGAALACKISAVYFSPIILLFFLLHLKKDFRSFLFYLPVFFFLSIFFFRLFQPQAFSTGNFLNWFPNPQFIQNLRELKSYDQNPAYPPSIQWLKVIPLWFPLKNILLWGLGLPAGLVFIASVIFILAKPSLKTFPLIFWILFLILVQGFQPVSTLRYFLPIYPFISIISGYFICSIFSHRFLIVILLLIYPLMFISIFFRLHSRVAASDWIYQNISVGSTIATEYWDDALPLPIGDSYPSLYQNLELHVADLESDQKMTLLKYQLDQSDYLILSSNRFYKPIPQNSDIFPQTARYYQSLFDGSLGFKKVAEFVSYPCFFYFCLNDDSAEEVFTVYDHPKVIIFKKDIR